MKVRPETGFIKNYMDLQNYNLSIKSAIQKYKETNTKIKAKIVPMLCETRNVVYLLSHKSELRLLFSFAKEEKFRVTIKRFCFYSRYV